jgi:release factor glutamine methyltransferase
MRPPIEALWRLYRRWRFRLFQQHRHRRLVLEHVAGMPLLVLPDVFNPGLFHTSEALVRAVDGELHQLGERVLDLGTGTGIAAIAAARRGARVIAVDISPEAVRCAQINVRLNRVEESVEVRQGDLFEPVRGEGFDLVLFNPPFYAGVPGELWEVAWRSEDVLERFAHGLLDVLNPTGRAILVVSSTTVGLNEAIAIAHIRSRTLWERDMVNERLAVLEWTARVTGEVLA